MEPNKLLFPMNTNNLLMYYKGQFNELVLAQMGGFLKKHFESPRLRKRAFSIFIELAQNISRYSGEKNLTGSDSDKHGVGSIALYKEADKYIIKSGNFLSTNQAVKLERKCKMLNKMPFDELRLLKRKIKLLPREKGQKGASIGLIQVIMDSGLPISIQVAKLDQESIVFFLITITVKSEQ